jgi:hypothetical protein
MRLRGWITDRRAARWSSVKLPERGTISVALPSPDRGFADHLLITASQAMGLGAV